MKYTGHSARDRSPPGHTIRGSATFLCGRGTRTPAARTEHRRSPQNGAAERVWRVAAWLHLCLLITINCLYQTGVWLSLALRSMIVPGLQMPMGVRREEILGSQGFVSPTVTPCSLLSLSPRNDPVDLRCPCGAFHLNLKGKVSEMNVAAG
jgi:hypothetical protein